MSDFTIQRLRYSRCCSFCGVRMPQHIDIAVVTENDFRRLAHIECARKALGKKPEDSEYARAYVITDGERYAAAQARGLGYLRRHGSQLGRAG